MHVERFAGNQAHGGNGMGLNRGRRQLLSGMGVGAALALTGREWRPQRAGAATLFASATPATAAVAGGVVYVSPQGNDGNDGLGWATAKLTVGAALAALPTGGTVFLAAGTFTGSGLAIPSGGNIAIRGAGPGVTVLQTTSGDLWTVPANSSFVSFEDLSMVSATGAGHLFNAATSSLSFWSWRRCQLIQANDAKCIWYTSSGIFINCTISECNEEHTLTATVPSWYLKGAISGNTWEKLRHTNTGNYAISIETPGPSAFCYGNSFRDITWEVCNGGFITLLGQFGGTLDNLISYDGGTLTRDGYVFGPGGSKKLSCYGLRVSGLVRLNPQVLGQGVVDISCAALGRGVISGCNGTIDLAGMDVLAENLLYGSSPTTVLQNNSGTTELSALDGSLVRPPVTSVTASYQATASDSIIIATTAKGGLTVTLPPVSGLTGKQYTIKKADTTKTAVKVAAHASQHIDGAAAQSLTAGYSSLTVVCDGTAWQVV
jgi:hypothetical protein